MRFIHCLICKLMQKIHISTLRAILKAGDPVDLDVWTSTGSIMHLKDCIPLRSNFYKGTRNMKILASGQIRAIREVCIFRVNGCMEVYL